MLSGDIANCRPIYLPPHPVMRSVASNASYKLPAPLLSRVSTEKRREGEVDRWREGGARERGRERGVWRPRFSSRDVNNDRNDRIRPRPLVFRVTSGRVIVSVYRGTNSMDGASRIEEGILLLLLPFSPPFSGPLFDCPSSSYCFVGSWSVRRLCAI